MLVPLTDPENPYSKMMFHLIDDHRSRAYAPDPRLALPRRPSLLRRALTVVSRVGSSFGTRPTSPDSSAA
jgi:hypothetical protein